MHLKLDFIDPVHTQWRMRITLTRSTLYHFRYLSTLYSHPEFRNIHPNIVQDELRKNVEDNWIWLMTPSWLYKHIKIIYEKKKRGQPISFTDFFGYLVGETILKDVSVSGNLLNLPLFDYQDKMLQKMKG